MPETISIIAESDYAVLINKGITDAKGSVNEALAFLMPEDLIDLGRKLADRAANIRDLFSVVVDPINSIVVAIEKGHYTSVYEKVNEKNIVLLEAEGAKRIYFVPVTEDVDTGGEESYVNKFGLTLCKKAPNYLTGAMAALPEDKLPAELAGKDFVAAEDAESSVFQGHVNRCFLYVYRGGGKREIRLFRVVGRWVASGDWVFLAEKP